MARCPPDDKFVSVSCVFDSKFGHFIGTPLAKGACDAISYEFFQTCTFLATFSKELFLSPTTQGLA